MVRVSPLVVSCNNFVLCVCGSGLSLCACQLFFSLSLFLPLPRCSLAPLQVPHFFQKLKRKSVSRSRDRHETMLSETKQKLLREKGIESDGYFFQVLSSSCNLFVLLYPPQQTTTTTNSSALPSTSSAPQFFLLLFLFKFSFSSVSSRDSIILRSWNYSLTEVTK